VVRLVVISILPTNDPAFASNNLWRRYFGSAHTGGINAVMGDGSVRFISYNVDPVTFMWLNAVDDGQAVGSY
jgi:prepilin-type processing-associated H-X9-DG protein